MNRVGWNGEAQPFIPRSNLSLSALDDFGPSFLGSSTSCQLGRDKELHSADNFSVSRNNGVENRDVKISGLHFLFLSICRDLLFK